MCMDRALLSQALNPYPSIRPSVAVAASVHLFEVLTGSDDVVIVEDDNPGDADAKPTSTQFHAPCH